MEEHYHRIVSFLKSHSNLWRIIGFELGFFPNELDTISSNPVLIFQSSPTTSFLGKMIEHWLQWAPGDGRGSKNFATFEDLQAALLKVDGFAAKAYDLKGALSGEVPLKNTL